MLIPSVQVKQLDGICKKMTFVGCSSVVYCLIDLAKYILKYIKNVKFNEEKESKKKKMNVFSRISMKTSVMLKINFRKV